MPPTAKRIHALKKRLGVLDKRFLPKPSLLGTYSRAEQDMVRAFRLLAHAEIESFFEGCVLTIVESAVKKFKRSHRPNSVLRAIHQSFCRETELTGGKDAYDVAVKKFQNAIKKKNHGVTEKNLCGMLLPIGVDHKSLDVAWLGTMNTFGEQRGLVAHNSFRVKAVLDPSTEKTTIAQVITVVEELHRLLSPLINK